MARTPTRRSRRSRRQGGTALEFALLVPVWLTVIAGIADFSWLVYSQTTLDAAVNVGCRAGSLVDPGAYDEQLDLVTDLARQRTVAMMTDLGADCSDCTFDLVVAGDYPDRTLSCQVSRPFDAALGLVVGDRQLTSSHLAHMEFQYEEPLL